jgi:hypothetical protein
MLEKIFNLGITPDMDDYLRSRITVANQLAFLVSFVVFFYLTVYAFTTPAILPIMYVGVAMNVLVFVLNALKINVLARILVSVLPAAFSVYLTAALSQSYDDILYAGYTFNFAFLLLPFIVFGLRESLWLTISFVVVAVHVFLTRYFSVWIDISMDNSFYKTPLMEGFSTAFSIAIIALSMLVMLRSNQHEEKISQRLIAEMDAKNREADLARQQLQITLQEVEKARQEDERRAWASNGIAQLTILMRQENDLKKLYDELISKLVQYLGVNQGGLYVVEGENEHDPHIQLRAAYAYDRKKFLEQRIELGQGLLGEVYQEKERILLTEVPEKYITITSGLGEAPPRCIAIVPLIVNEEVQGMIEVAGFEVLESYKLEFLERLGENIAAMLKNHDVNARTKMLLEESQMQSEMMKAQEEEMRQNMEELMATQEEIERKEREYISRIEELESRLGENTSVLRR